MSQTVKCNLFLYADDTCLVCQHKDINEIERKLDEDFESICNWFADNKLSIYSGDDKTKSILFATKFKIKVRKLNIKYGNIQIKQYSKVKYLGYMLDEIMSRETMTLSVVVNKINNKLKFLYRKKTDILTPTL